MTNNIYTKADKKITDFIYEKPEVVSRLLDEYGYKMSDYVTLPEIIEKTFKALYVDGNKKFATSLDAEIFSDGYSNFVAIAVSAALSIAGMFTSSRQAKKAMELQRKIAMAQLSTERMLREEEIRVGAETERTRILLQTLQQYQSDLQKQSTLRLKNTWVYGIMLGVSAGIVYGIYLLLGPNDGK